MAKTRVPFTRWILTAGFVGVAALTLAVLWSAGLTPFTHNSASALAGGYVVFANHSVCDGSPGVDVVADITGSGAWRPG